MSSTLYSPTGAVVDPAIGPSSHAIHTAWAALGEIQEYPVPVTVRAGEQGFQDVLVPQGRVDAFVRTLVANPAVHEVTVNGALAFKNVTI